MKKQLLLFFFLFKCLLSFSQGEGNHWYFGYNAGLDFTSGNPLPDLNGALYTDEGCSAVSDKNGNLLFYTDGSQVYNRNHLAMPNGNGLLGNSSSTQSAIIVKKPGSDTIYYIFTTPAVSSGGFYYSEVNTKLDGGKGDIIVTTKNTNLLPVVGERVTAAKHSNGIYTWIITKGTNTDAYYAYLIDCNGIQPPVITNIGLSTSGSNIGATVASPDSKKIASTFFDNLVAIEILDFNNSTGVFSNAITQTQSGGPYGACFSPNSNLFYFSNVSSGNVTQLDLNAGSGSSVDVLASATIVGTLPGGSGYAGQLQLGPDRKIYMAQDLQTSISVINNPNAIGTACNFVPNTISLGGQVSAYGLPAFFLNFLDTAVIKYNYTCLNSPTFFSINSDTTGLDSVHWDFGDIPSGINNYSHNYSSSHIYSAPGNYTVQLIRYFLCGSDTNTVTVTIASGTVVASANGTNNICRGGTVQLNASGGIHYSWTGPANYTDTSQTASINNAINSGLYIVTVKDANGCTDTASVNVNIHPVPLAVANSNSPVAIGSTINLSTDTVSGIGWTGPNGFTSVQQNPIITNAQLNNSGTYQLIKTNSFGCKDTAETIVSVYQSEIPDNGIDDDGDGLIDCADPDLATLKQCYVCGYDSIAWKTIIPEPGFNKGIAVKFTGYDQHFIVPASVTAIKIKAWGAGGGGGYTIYNAAAGAGGYTVDQLTTSPGETYVVVTGEGGWATRSTDQTARSTFGFGGSGNSDAAPDVSETGSGGGLSGVFFNTVTQTNARVIAGGGGGIGDAGGYDETSGGNGNNPLSGGYLPLNGQNAIANSTGMGGGGGGYVGGISGIYRFFYRGGTPAGGEGGSGFKYTSSGSIMYTPELNINPPAMTDIHYLNGIGVGNDYNMTVGAAGDVKTGGNGLVVIQWFEPVDDLTITATKDSICKGDTLTLIASGHSKYMWAPSATLSSDTAKTVIASPIVNTTYQVISDYNNCKDTAQVNIVVHQLPNLTITPNSSVCKGNSIQINAGGATNYSWLPAAGLDTLSGTTVTASPSVTTEYYVTGKDANNCIATDSLKITVDTLPIAFITGSTNMCVGSTAVLTASGDGTYLWNTGEISAAITIAPTVTTPYTVVVKNSNNCIDSAKIIVDVHPVPASQFYAANVCNGSAVLFNNLSTITSPGTIQSYAWNFGDGSSLNTTSTPSHMYSTDSSYSVQLLAVSDFGCSDSIAKTITVNPKPHVSFTANDTLGCSTFCISFLNSSSIHSGNNSQWLWNFGDGTATSNSGNPNHCYNNNSSPISYTVALTVTSDSGCVNMLTKNNYIEVHPNPTTKFSATNVCDGSTIPFVDMSTIPTTDTIQSWTWNFGDGSPLNINRNPLHLYTATGSYSVKLLTISDFGCRDSILQTCVVNPNPVVDFTAVDTSGCEPLCVNFQNSSHIVNGAIASLSWNFGDGSPLSNSSDIFYCYSNNSVLPQSYTPVLTVISDSGCTITKSKNNYITVYPSPDASFAADPTTATITEPVISITDVSVGANFWNWNFGGNDTTSLHNPPPHRYADTGTYVIRLITATQYGCMDTAYQTVFIEPDFTFYIPTAFTPDDDGVNDTFTGKGSFVKEFEMTIFDRWGNLIYQTDDINKPWDGRANHTNDMAQRDIYVYVIKVTDFKMTKHNYKGIVTLLR